MMELLRAQQCTRAATSLLLATVTQDHLVRSSLVIASLHASTVKSTGQLMHVAVWLSMLCFPSAHLGACSSAQDVMQLYNPLKPAIADGSGPLACLRPRPGIWLAGVGSNWTEL